MELYPPDAPGRPTLGLVCLSGDGQVAFRNITRARFLGLGPTKRVQALRDVYWENVQRLHWALTYCHARDIRLYRLSSAIFPLADYKTGRDALHSLEHLLASVGRRAERLGIRLVLHPDQFVVLNSESAKTRRTSRVIMDKYALAFDLMGLPRSPASLMNVHGGKAGRGDELVAIIKDLPDGVRSRLTLENDEFSYSAADILDVCERAGVPMLFDCHHHVIHDRLATYDHESVARFTAAAAATWPDPALATYHVSNGDAAFRDRYHSRFITMMPRAFADVPYLEIEARGKEEAILALRRAWPATGDPDLTADYPLDKPTAAEKRAAEAEEAEAA